MASTDSQDDDWIFQLRKYMCSNGYTINIDMSNIFIKIYKCIYSNDLYKLYMIGIDMVSKKQFLSIINI